MAMAGDPPCGDWGDAPDGIQYFEVQPGARSVEHLFQVGDGSLRGQPGTGSCTAST